MSDDEQMDMGGDDYQQDFDPDELKWVQSSLGDHKKSSRITGRCVLILC